MVGSQLRVWVRSNLDISQMREAMKTEEWTVAGSYHSQADSAQQFQLSPGKVWELESGKWGCDIFLTLTGVWNIILETQKASGQKQSVTVGEVFPVTKVY